MVPIWWALITIGTFLTDFVRCDQSSTKRQTIGEQYLKDEVRLLRERLGEMEGKVEQLQKECNRRDERFVADGEVDMEQELIRLRQDVNQIKQGYMGGNAYTDQGGPANYVCLPEDPMWGKYQDGMQDHGNKMYGTEYELFGSFNPFDKQLHDEDAPCAVCRTQYETTIMIPARTDCYSGWQRQYTGYLMTISTIHQAAGEYVCVDSSPEQILHGSGNQNGNILYVVEAACGSLPCLPYVNGRELTCVVCSK